MEKIEGHTESTEKLFQNKIWLNVSEASEYARLSKSMLYKYKQYGIPAYSSSGKANGSLRFNKDDLDKWWDERKIS